MVLLLLILLLLLLLLLLAMLTGMGWVSLATMLAGAAAQRAWR